ncbi:MAG TPA: endonuclease/exonuclease/phosphatase family protein [Gemmatimonadaceae bacterium]
MMTKRSFVVLALLATACHRGATSSPAPTAGTLKVLVYNVHAGKDAKGVDNLQRVADVVKASGADVVLLQEVDKGTRRSGKVDQPSEYAKRTGFHAAFGRSLDYDGGEYGIAILSRWPMRGDTAIHLPVEPPQERSGGSHEPRVAMRAIVASPYGELLFLNTHIDASGDERWRLQEIQTIIPLAKTRSTAFVGGDFNSTPESAVQQQLRASGLRDSWTTCGTGNGLSYPADVPVKRIDYLFLTGAAECTHAEVLVNEASDHRPVLFTVRFGTR